MDAVDLWRASGRLEEAVRALTWALADSGCTDRDVGACNWGVLRALAAYQEVALDAENPAVLEWVPPLLEIEAGDRVHDKVVLFATWVFSVTDEERVIAAGRGDRVGESGPVPDDAADVVSAFFDDELDLREETVGGWRQLGLDLEFVQHSAHRMLADADGVHTDTGEGGDG